MTSAKSTVTAVAKLQHYSSFLVTLARLTLCTSSHSVGTKNCLKSPSPLLKRRWVRTARTPSWRCTNWTCITELANLFSSATSSFCRCKCWWNFRWQMARLKLKSTASSYEVELCWTGKHRWRSPNKTGLRNRCGIMLQNLKRYCPKPSPDCPLLSTLILRNGSTGSHQINQSRSPPSCQENGKPSAKRPWRRWSSSGASALTASTLLFVTTS